MSATQPCGACMTDRRRARRGRISARERSSAGAIAQMDWNVPVNTDSPTEPLDDEGVQALDHAAMCILEEIGIEFLNPESLSILGKAGCRVDGTNVRMDRDFVAEMIGAAPAEFDITPRNPDRRVRIGGRNMVFGNVSSPPNTYDIKSGKQVGTQDYFRKFLKLTQYFNCIHIACGYPVEPVDIHPSVRHLDCVRDKLLMTDKVVHAYSLGAERVEDVMEMVRIAGGLTEDQFTASPHLFTNINSTSPLKHDLPMLDGAMRMARRGQVVFVTPFTLAGAMAPVTMPGAVAQSMAEGLAAIALLQVIKPGAPCVFGTFTSNVDMRSGAPAFGTPEYMRATQMTGQMCRYYGLPLRASNACAANVPDGQAVWESVNSLWSAVQAGVNVVYHAAGWLEGGLIACPEKFIMDCEVLQQIQRYFDTGLTDVEDMEDAVEAIREVGCNGHFFGAKHTRERYKTAFYSPFVSDWQNFEAWEAGGGAWTASRSHEIYKRILEDYEPPPIDPDTAASLEEFVEQRKAEGGAPTDY